MTRLTRPMSLACILLAAAGLSRAAATGGVNVSGRSAEQEAQPEEQIYTQRQQRTPLLQRGLLAPSPRGPGGAPASAKCASGHWGKG